MLAISLFSTIGIGNSTELATKIALSDFVGGNEQHAETSTHFDFRATRND